MRDTLIGVNADIDRLEAVITRMQAVNAELTIDDCCDAIFNVGILAVAATFKLTEKQPS